ncbi:MAG: 2-oxoacid:ferredoxin oxidoreductase subunit beta [Chloroflexi bacterium]|nr:2-oxoacid:ferredoxin oxidoreductase subunit beta [Chloroflexota bacterium]
MTTIQLTRKDFVSDQTVRWCPGCGDYAILAQMQKVLPELGIPKENIVFISGIGCSSRFPYYMNTYGIHSIHGRAPTLATGLKLANPDLSVWVITGDGDALSIGGNHLLHAARRNVDINLILFNNRIYGLTKGQYSPTSPRGTRTKSSPMGTIEWPLNPISIALAAEATFVARTVDVLQKHMHDIFLQAANHKGFSFVEVLQNCVIFNDGAWEQYANRKLRDDNDIFLEPGKPMVFGRYSDKGLIQTPDGLEIVELNDEYTIDDLAVHHVESLELAWELSRFQYPKPLPLGVIYNVTRETFGEGVRGQIADAKVLKGEGDLYKLYNAGETWQVKKNGRK